MPEIPPKVITQKLNIDSKFKLIRQKKRSFASKRQKAIDEKVDKLQTIEFILEAHYPDWLANVVMTKKVNEKWWICIDYTDLNKTCLKDSFLLSKIDKLIDATSGPK